MYKRFMNFSAKILIANAFKNGLEIGSIANIVGCPESEVKDALNEVFGLGNAIFGRHEAKMKMGTVSKKF